MEIKGVSLSSIQKYAKEKLSAEQFQAWLDSLDTEVQVVMKDDVLVSSWFDLKKFSVEPVQKMGEVLSTPDIKKLAWDIGRFNAENSLKGIYAIFVKIGSPNFIISKASQILPTYYKPSKMEVFRKEDKKVTLHVTEFPDMDEITENRICGWIEKALEICGSQSISISITQSLTRGDQVSEYKISWL